ncbi:DNA cytosine methyltransferase [Blastococcus sp. KM273128]|nr:DNA cytosine methyltransferase [Blastococcus sp. KM273128]
MMPHHRTTVTQVTEPADQRSPNISRQAEEFRISGAVYERILRRTDAGITRSDVAPHDESIESALSITDRAERAWLRSATRPPRASGRTLRTVDLFSGCGGLTIGLEEAARALGRSFEPALAVDLDPNAIATYAHNFPDAQTVTASVTEVFDGSVRAALTTGERLIAKRHKEVDILVGGPPCQGHSDLNNRTRRNDAKNALYASMVRAAEVLSPAHVLIENVPGALHDKNGVVQRTADQLGEAGYHVTLDVVDLPLLGVPQTRKRLILAASRNGALDFESMRRNHARSPRDVRWAMEDLQDSPSTTSSRMFETARSNPDTRRRMRFLFERDLYDLPDSERPPCHASGGHTYSSIYGRLRWDRPSQTITRGFYSMCMGRYVHPSRERTLTAREAARLQYIPDWFQFPETITRTALATMIGNAVPSRLTTAIALEWLR